MHNILVYASTASTRLLYQQKLSLLGMDVYRAKDPAEFFLTLVTFDIDTIVLVNEGKEYEFDLILKVLQKRYDHKRIYLVSLAEKDTEFERFVTSQDFFDSI